MKISETCECGSRFDADDRSAVYVGKAAREWRADHNCSGPAGEHFPDVTLQVDIADLPKRIENEVRRSLDRIEYGIAKARREANRSRA